MYMCCLIVYTLWEMCWGVVVLGGTQSLAVYYNIRHEDLHEILTFTTYKFMRVWAVATL